ERERRPFHHQYRDRRNGGRVKHRQQMPCCRSLARCHSAFDERRDRGGERAGQREFVVELQYQAPLGRQVVEVLPEGLDRVDKALSQGCPSQLGSTGDYVSKRDDVESTVTPDVTR